MKIVITGAAGRLGRNVTAALGQHELVLLTHSPAADLPGKNVAVDLAEPGGLDQIFAAEKPDIVIHLAAMIGGACESNPDLAQKINVDATQNIARAAAAHGAKHLLFASTAAVYNQTNLAKVDEASSIEPCSVYGRTKLAAEHALAEIAKTSGLRCTVFRIFNIYGPDFAESLVYKLAHSTAENPVQLYGLDTFYRDYIYAGDVVRVLCDFAAIDALPDKYNVFNIAAGRAINNTQLIDALKSHGITPHFTAKDAAPSYSWADIGRAQQLLGFDPRVDIIV